MVNRVHKITTDKAPLPSGPYSQGVQGGGNVYVSGMLPIDPATGNMVIGGIERQLKQVVDNIAAILRTERMELSDIVKVDVSLASINDLGPMNEAYASLIPHAPAMDWFVGPLPKDAFVKMSCTAYLGN